MTLNQLVVLISGDLFGKKHGWDAFKSRQVKIFHHGHHKLYLMVHIREWFHQILRFWQEAWVIKHVFLHWQPVDSWDQRLFHLVLLSVQVKEPSLFMHLRWLNFNEPKFKTTSLNYTSETWSMTNATHGRPAGITLLAQRWTNKHLSESNILIKGGYCNHGESRFN